MTNVATSHSPPIIHSFTCTAGLEFYRGNAAIAVEGEQNAVDHCGNDGNFLPYSAIFIVIFIVNAQWCITILIFEFRC